MAYLAAAAAIIGTVVSVASAVEQSQAQSAAAAAAAANQRYAASAAQAQATAQQQEQNFVAAQQTQQAGQERAIAQRRAIAANIQTQYALSRARAVAAAGGGAQDPSVFGVEKQIEGAGTFDALSALSSGEERARGFETGAAVSKYQGQLDILTGTVNSTALNTEAANTAAIGNLQASATQTNALGTLLSSGGSLYSKYGQLFSPSTSTPAPSSAGTIPNYG